MIQLGFILSNYQSVETENLLVFFGKEDRIGGQVFWRKSEVSLPVPDPMFRVTPKTLGLNGDF